MKLPTSLCLLALAASFSTSPLRADQEFDPIAAELTDRAVVMKLPDGVRRVRLRIRNEDGSWKTSTIAHLEGNEGYLKLRLPDGVQKDDLEITASWSDPFPFSFYQGTSDHQGTASETAIAANPLSPQFREGDSVDAEGGGEEVTVEESDIWKWRGNTLYFFNQYRGLQVIDVSDPAAPDRIASLPVNSYGEQMYLHPDKDVVVLLTHDNSTGNGKVVMVAHEATHLLQEKASFPVPGYILESRLVGKILYVVSRNSWQDRVTDPEGTEHISWRSGLAITKINLSNPDDPIADEPIVLSSDQYNYWGAQIQATPRALLISTNAYDSARRQSLSTIHVVDISNPDTVPTVTHRLPIKGQVLNKFNMNLSGETLTVVSQVWRWSAENRRRYASVETYDLSGSNPKLDSLEFASNETITATRFVDDLLYVVTFFQVDPLFVIDLTDPTRLKLLSELVIPGFSTYLQPFGKDALISIGVEDSRIAVSWFDVGDPTLTSLASRIYIGEEDGWSWSEANWDEKALGFFPEERLMLVPFQGSVPGKGWTTGVQLVELGDREVIKRGSFEHDFPARRARVVSGNAVVSISGRALKSLDISDRDNPRLLAELTLAWPADIVHRVDDFLVQLERGPGYWWYDGVSSVARLHVSPVDDPDELLHSLDLPGGRIVGSFLHHDCLFVAHSQVVSEELEDRVETSQTFTTTVVSLATPDRPVVSGRAIHTTTGENARYGYGSDYRGDLLPDGSLVWYPAEQNNYYFGPFFRGVADDILFPQAPNSGRVYTVDISEKTKPVILASADLGSENGAWPEGEIVLLGDTIYHSVQKSEWVEQADDERKWISRHLLGRLDLSDPAAPVVEDFVTIPGTFEHVLRTPSDGTILFTTSFNYIIEAGLWRNELHVQALAFDGVQAFLLNELVVPDRSYGPRLFDDRFLVLSKSDHSGGEVNTELTFYEWLEAGSFEELHTLEEPSSVYRLGVSDHLLMAIGQKLTFIDFADPTDPDPVRASFSVANFWQPLELIDIHERKVAHLPLGFYGVQSIDFGGAFDDSVPADSPSQGEDGLRWEGVPLSGLIAAHSSDTLLLGELPEGKNWLYGRTVLQISFQDWTRMHLGLAPKDPLPSPSHDSDFDGASNLWEYFTGTNPGDPADVSRLRLSLVEHADGDRYLHGYLSINPHAASAVRVAAEVSSDLENWDDTPGLVEIVPDSFRPGVVLQHSEPVSSARATLLRAVLNSAP